MRFALFLQRVLHFADRRFTAAILGDLRVLRAAARRNLANKGKVTPLQLPRGCLLGGDGRTTTASSSSATLRRRGLRCPGPSAANTAADYSSARTERLQPLLQLLNLEIPIEVAGGDAPVIDERLQNPLRLRRG